MKRIRPFLVLISCCGLGHAGLAAADDAAAYREPSDMKVEERMAIMQRMNDYHGCVYREAMARVDKLPDIRQAADEGMAACQGPLDALQETIEAYRFSPQFGEQFVHHAQSRAVKMLLPELSLRKGAQ
ncbi:MAG TPA: hypothetical protein PJ986_18545 [Gammaproteobacteria bacterium]|nr:hypothetical protein [Gammaproteobacteria bacterium]